MHHTDFFLSSQRPTHEGRILKAPHVVIPTLSIPRSCHPLFITAFNSTLGVRGAPWSATNRLHGQRTGAFSLRPVLGLSRKTDQFRLDPTQNCAPGFWCDRKSSVYHLALEMYSGIFRHATWLCPACLPSTCSIPAPIQPTIAMTTTHKHQLCLTRPPSTRSSSASEDHHQAPVVTQQQQQQHFKYTIICRTNRESRLAPPSAWTALT